MEPHRHRPTPAGLRLKGWCSRLLRATSTPPLLFIDPIGGGTAPSTRPPLSHLRAHPQHCLPPEECSSERVKVCVTQAGCLPHAARDQSTPPSPHTSSLGHRLVCRLVHSGSSSHAGSRLSAVSKSDVLSDERKGKLVTGR
ncbi:hypothetical protein E2C01_081383 [Portunus trituberculatus]|uniref:Uncharacterized protein n=1 Tax=Portunus trituberculatus TaxID=210409 RepID=A0A5B7IRT7_PORTR|nr:hypothetical protein [Portunus trituberculatus]